MTSAIIDKYVRAFLSACGLNDSQARTVALWALATYGIEKLDIMPILAILGPQGTGKSTLLALLEQIVYAPKRIDGKVSPPVLRDNLRPDTTVIIEEADTIHEQLILARYSRKTADTAVNRGSAAIGYYAQSMNLFGATAMHRRVPFGDPAVDSRSIIIRTTYKPGAYATPTIDGTDLKIIADQTDWWTKQIALPSGRIYDTWSPLFRSALASGEIEWPVYAHDEIQKINQRFTAGHAYEPQNALVYSLQAMMHPNTLLPNGEPVKVADIKNHLFNQWEIKLKNRQVEEMCRTLGFSVTKPQGCPTVKPNDMLLKHLIDDIESRG
jgi:energy-coupling factor transporter ATP-binding protein EcfA2